MKRKIYYFLNVSKVGGFILGALIVISIVIFCAETEYADVIVFRKLNMMIACIFAVEYVLRIWTANCLPSHVKSPRVKYMTSFLGIIDVLAFLPVLLMPIFSGTLLLRLLRVLRLAQVLKLKALSQSFRRVTLALKEAKSELAITMLMSSLLIFIGAVMMYFVEGTAQYLAPYGGQ